MISQALFENILEDLFWKEFDKGKALSETKLFAASHEALTSHITSKWDIPHDQIITLIESLKSEVR